MKKNGPEQLKSEVRQFGLGVGCLLLLAGGVLWLVDRPAGPFLLAAGAIAALAGWFSLRGMVPVYRGWMRIAAVLARVMTTILLTLLYLLVLCPTALLARVCGKRFLDLSTGDEVTTYWLSREPGADEPQRAERQY